MKGESFVTQAAATAPVPMYSVIRKRAGDVTKVSPFPIHKCFGACVLDELWKESRKLQLGG